MWDHRARRRCRLPVAAASRRRQRGQHSDSEQRSAVADMEDHGRRMT